MPVRIPQTRIASRPGESPSGLYRQVYPLGAYDKQNREAFSKDTGTDWHRDQKAKSMTTIKAMRLASVVTAINVLVTTGFSIVGIIRPQYLVSVESVPTQASLILAMYAAARTIPLALFALGAIYKQAMPALLILGTLAGAMQLLDAGIGLFEHDVGKCAGPLFIAVLQFLVMYLLHRSVRITPQTKSG
jgi:hypothetical protein